MATDVRHDTDNSRYELVVDNEVVSIAEYRDSGDSLVFSHTLTYPGHRDRGYAARVVRGALEDVQSKGRSVVPTCWFVREFIDLNPEFKDLVTGD